VRQAGKGRIEGGIGRIWVKKAYWYPSQVLVVAGTIQNRQVSNTIAIFLRRKFLDFGIVPCVWGFDRRRETGKKA
jgi:hypothetical protein